MTKKLKGKWGYGENAKDVRKAGMNSDSDRREGGIAFVRSVVQSFSRSIVQSFSRSAVQPFSRSVVQSLT